MTTDRVSGAVLALVGLLWAWESRGLPFGSLRDPGPAFLPVALALLLAALGLLLCVGGARSPSLDALRWGEGRHAAAILGACAFAALALERLGYRWTTLVMVLFLARVVERKRPLAALAVALALSFGSYLLFARGLKVPLPRGPFGM